MNLKLGHSLRLGLCAGNGNGNGVNERDLQKQYWVQHSADLSVEAMMLDSKAAHLDKEERPEVFSLPHHLSDPLFVLSLTMH